MNIRNSCFQCLLQVNMEVRSIQAVDSDGLSRTGKSFRKITFIILDHFDLTPLHIALRRYLLPPLRASLNTRTISQIGNTKNRSHLSRASRLG